MPKVQPHKLRSPIGWIGFGLLTIGLAGGAWVSNRLADISAVQQQQACVASGSAQVLAAIGEALDAPPAPSQERQVAVQTIVNNARALRACAVDQSANVLGPYPLQHVRNRVDGAEGPTLHDGETAEITGKLCATRAVNVLTTLSWQAVGQTGTFVTVGRDVPQHRKAGCERFTFRNPMPVEVVDASRTLRSVGVDAVWVVTGFEIPLVGGREGPRETFTSQAFRVVP